MGVLVLMFGWHLYLTTEAKRIVSEAGAESAGEGRVDLSVNPITNVVEMKIVLPPPAEPDKDNPLANIGQGFGAAIGAGLVKMMEPLVERELNTKARESYDVYAILVPYRLRISMDQPNDEQLARFRTQREEKRQAEDKVRRDAVAAYIANGLRLEEVRVGEGRRFGQTEKAVFGTVVNGGEKTLKKVAVRVFFLDANGHRIGEKDYSPILVTEFSFGDNTPLRPGYRKDFGYAVEDDAPSGWAGAVEAEIVEINFLEPPTEG